MKKFILLILMFVSTYSFAQIDATVNPIGILWGDLSAGADFIFNDHLSLETKLGFGTGKRSNADVRNVNVVAFGKYYFNPNQGADKFYGGMFMKYIFRNYQFDANSSRVNYNSRRFGIGFGGGFKHVSAHGLVFDINAGIGRAFSEKYSITQDNFDPLNLTDIMFVFKLGVGYRFKTK